MTKKILNRPIPCVVCHQEIKIPLRNEDQIFIECGKKYAFENLTLSYSYYIDEALLAYKKMILVFLVFMYLNL
ncbi:hypothetical protein [Listeria goaensis]|uniref:hypothetical protein n=1 Tax=Listeria goaensis TaxID=1649188 RepID=UPI000B590E74|nr:hypothetical protein [Listeria goaensis]